MVLPSWFPHRVLEVVRNVRPHMIVAITVLLSLTLAGKGRCFCVLVAHLQNVTCHTVGQTCGIAALNWIGDLGVAISFAGTPFITNMLSRFGIGTALGGMPTLQFAAIFTLGCLASGFVSDPESLIVTDTILQGVGASLLISVVALKLNELFPPESRYHVLATALVDAGPFGTVILCPLYGLILHHLRWSAVYLVVAVFLLSLCFVASLIDNGSTVLEKRPLIDSEEDQEDAKYEIDELKQPAPAATPPSLLDLLINANLPQLLSRAEVIVWLIERAIQTAVLYGLIMNLVDYMVVVVNEHITKACLIMLSFGGGEIIGFVMAVSIGDLIRHRLLHIYTGATVVVFIVMLAWQIVQKSMGDHFTNGDAHVMALVTGLAGACTNAYSFSIAEDIMEQPGHVAYPLTRLAQAVGLILAPLTSGVLISLDRYHIFFLVQAFMTLIRAGLLGFLIYRLGLRPRAAIPIYNLPTTSSPSPTPSPTPAFPPANDQGDTAGYQY